MRLRLAIYGGALLLLTACASPVEADGSYDPQPGSPVGSVGTLALSWSEATISEVGGYGDHHPEPQLIRSDDEWQAWLDGLPAEMLAAESADALSPDLSDAVAVVGGYPQCQEQSRVLDLGDGEVRFEVYVPKEDQQLECAWSPHRIDVWLVELDELGVDSADDVQLIE